jgi:hypothetical protein
MSSDYAQISYLPGTLTDCEAVSACGDTTQITYSDQVWDVHFLIKEQQWECFSYFYELASYEGDRDFTVVDSNVGAAYGYYYDD